MHDRYGVFYKSTGYIDYTIECTEDALISTIAPNKDYALFYGEQSDYYRNTETKRWNKKKDSGIFVSTTTPHCDQDITLSKIPAPCYLWIDTVKYFIEDTEIELSFTEPGAHSIKLDYGPYLPKEIKLDVCC